MGKYMKKSKIAGDIAVMEVSHQSTLGSRTRAAKTLALQRLQKTTPSPSPAQAVASTPDVSSFSYLQLRSRRLEKLPSPVSNETKQKQQGKESSFREGKKNGEKKSEGCFGKSREVVLGVGLCCETEEASFGENNLDFELRDRNTRETTPFSLIKDSETIVTPGSTTSLRSSSSTHRRRWNDVQRSIPTTLEMEEFFACAEQQQQQQFIEKYNFDIVTDLPLPGRYEWVQLIP
ncbi:cyclin-dependent kinase inhibitor 3-like [Durio zibethinus]|uniref:Cyclin-dependent kinase inhibitor 3-like n=1 Tax=Durio zibethinus TaxID=66656 RepID=A0A6P6B3F7_DURZI|nr:cyclin-dependent kinase inhibitor 3-like [Durio zibethinus]